MMDLQVMPEIIRRIRLENLLFYGANLVQETKGKVEISIEERF